MFFIIFLDRFTNMINFFFIFENALNTAFSNLLFSPPTIRLLINLTTNHELKMGSFLLKKITRLFSTNRFLIFAIF